ncbi:MAG: YtxH domain-containing protein [Coriobacteriia bacterium]
MKRTGGFGLFLLGGVAGAILGLAFAPRTGRETRQMVSDRAEQYWNQANELYVTGRDKVEDAVETGRHAATEKSDELKTKIEEARVRLQEQVAKSAEGAKERVADKTPVVTGAVDKAAEAAKTGVETASEKAQETLGYVARKAQAGEVGAEEKQESVTAGSVPPTGA